MAGIFTPGELKVRPGTYFNITKEPENKTAGAVDGITAVVFRSDWGPLGEAVELSAAEGYEKVFGTAGTTDAIAEAFGGGAETVIGVRLGAGGREASVKLKLAGEPAAEAVSVTAKYPGDKPFTITLRDKLTEGDKRECIIYDGEKEFEKLEFAKGGDEVKALVDAFSGSKAFLAQELSDVSGILADVSQEGMMGGENPSITVKDYSEGLALLEPYYFNTVCVDTEDSAVHALLSAFLNRILRAGQPAMGVIAGPAGLALEERMDQAAAFNDEKMHYVLNPSLETLYGRIEGYRTAARIAGMIASCPSNRSLTHTVLEDVTGLGERLTPTQMTKAETMGCIVLSVNSEKQVWIDSAINTLITPGEDQDDGWKKIRRTKTRYELITRANRQVEGLVGKVDNDTNGRATIVSQVQGVGNAMIEEGKLSACLVSENARLRSEGDNAFFLIEVVDKDSAEHIYLTFQFRFSTL